MRAALLSHPDLIRIQLPITHFPGNLRSMLQSASDVVVRGQSKVKWLCLPLSGSLKKIPESRSEASSSRDTTVCFADDFLGGMAFWYPEPRLF